MQSSSAAGGTQPEAILEWLHEEMGYRPSGKSPQLPYGDSIRRICRGNMIPVWSFLVNRVKSEKTVQGIRKNITVHGAERRSRDKASGLGGDGDRDAAERERESAVKEVERLRSAVRQQRKELRTRMLDVSREEAERKRMLDERAKNRHKQVMLEAYDQQCDEAAKIFAEYHKRLCHFVYQARDSGRSSVDTSAEAISSFGSTGEKDSVYLTVKGSKSAEDVILIETVQERNIRKACEVLASQTIERIHSFFPAYEGSGIHLNSQSEAVKLGIDYDGEVPFEIKTIVASCLKNPNLLLQAITSYTLCLKTVISREIEKTNVRADAETLRYKYENNRVMEVSSPDGSSPLHHQLYGNERTGTAVPSGGTQNQLLERQKAHVQQFLATEDALNKAAEVRELSQKLLHRLHGSGDGVSSLSIGVGGGGPHNIGSLRQFELEVWAKEREAAGLRASLNSLMSEIQRLNKLCAERKEAEESLRKKWKKIEEFDARRSELENIYRALLKANMDAAAFWDQQPLAAREYASSTIIPACRLVLDLANSAKDLIERDVEAVAHSPDNSLYMLPSTPQALLESMGSTGSTGLEAFAAAEKNAALLTARAGARDPSAIPSICRVSAALQYPAGLEGSDAGLASILVSLEFCLKLRGSEASVLEDLAKAINLVHVRKDLVESGHSLLNHAYRAQQEYERTTSYCLSLANEQEKAIVDKWLPELRTAVQNAQKCLEDCAYVRSLVNGGSSRHLWLLTGLKLMDKALLLGTIMLSNFLLIMIKSSYELISQCHACTFNHFHATNYSARMGKPYLSTADDMLLSRIQLKISFPPICDPATPS